MMRMMMITRMMMMMMVMMMVMMIVMTMVMMMMTTISYPNTICFLCDESCLKTYWGNIAYGVRVFCFFQCKNVM